MERKCASWCHKGSSSKYHVLRPLVLGRFPGNSSHFCTPVLISMCNITFQVLELSRLLFSLTSVQKKIFTIIFVVRSLKGFKRNNVGPASQMVARHYISIGPMYRVIWCFWPLDVNSMVKRVTSIMQPSENTIGLQSPNAVSMTGQRRRLWVNIETALVECHVFKCAE